MVNGKEKVQLVPAHSLLLFMSIKGTARLYFYIQWMNHCQKYSMPSQHMYCGRVCNLMQAFDVKSNSYKLYISNPPSSEV